MRLVGAALAGGLGCSLLVAAAAAGEALRLTMADAVTRAIAASPDLQSDRKSVDVAAAVADRSAAWLPADPYLSLGAQGFFDREQTVFLGDNDEPQFAVSETKLRVGYGLSLSQEFEVAGQRGWRLKVAERGLESTRLEARAAELTLVAAVQTVFTRALIHARRVEIARQTLANAVELREDVERARASGLARIGVNQARIQESRMRVDLAEAEQAHGDSLAHFRYLLDLPAGQPLDLVGEMSGRPEETPAEPILVARALERRPDLLAARARVQRAEDALELTSRDRLPNVTVSGFVSQFDGDTFAGGDVGISLPLVRRRSADVAEAVAERDQANFQLRDLEHIVEWQVVQGRRAVETARLALGMARDEILPRAEENLEIERRLMHAGDVGVAEFIGMQVDALVAQREYLDALQTYHEARIELERVAGGTLGE